MSLKTVPLANKPLCAVLNDGMIYMGDARGFIYVISGPHSPPKKILETPAPVSAIVCGNVIYYGTWDGTVYTEGKFKNLGKDMIKCMTLWRNILFVSVDLKLFLLDLDLNIIEEHNTASKIYCSESFDNRIVFGMGHGYTSVYSECYESAKKYAHDGSIISMKNDLSGDTYGKLKKGNSVLYCSEAWIRSIWDETLFSSGKDVVRDGKVLYSHTDEITGVIKMDGIIYSFGLDYCYKIYSEGIILNEQEEEECMRLLNS